MAFITVNQNDRVDEKPHVFRDKTGNPTTFDYNMNATLIPSRHKQNALANTNNIKQLF